MKNKINGKIISDYLQKNNIPKTAFCKRCGISAPTLYRIINGKSSCKLLTLFKIARNMNCTITDLHKKL